MWSLIWKMSDWNPIFFFNKQALSSSLLSTPASTRPSSSSLSPTHHQHPLSCLFCCPNFNSNQFLWQWLDHLLPAIWNHLTTKMFFVPKFPQQIFIVAFATPIAKKILPVLAPHRGSFLRQKVPTLDHKTVLLSESFKYTRQDVLAPNQTKTTSDQTWTDQVYKRAEHYINH